MSAPRDWPPALAAFEPDPAFAACEQAWIGGVGDFGDRDAAQIARTLPGYFDYRSEIEEALRAGLGDSFPVWRATSAEALESWRAGWDVGCVSVTLNPNVARAFTRFAGFRDRTALRLVRLDVAPEEIVLRGHPAERELVLDAGEIDAARLVDLGPIRDAA